MEIVNFTKQMYIFITRMHRSVGHLRQRNLFLSPRREGVRIRASGRWYDFVLIKITMLLFGRFLKLIESYRKSGTYPFQIW